MPSVLELLALGKKIGIMFFHVKFQLVVLDSVFSILVLPSGCCLTSLAPGLSQVCETGLLHLLRYLQIPFLSLHSTCEPFIDHLR